MQRPALEQKLPVPPAGATSAAEPPPSPLPVPPPPLRARSRSAAGVKSESRSAPAGGGARPAQGHCRRTHTCTAACQSPSRCTADRALTRPVGRPSASSTSNSSSPPPIPPPKSFAPPPPPPPPRQSLLGSGALRCITQVFTRAPLRWRARPPAKPRAGCAVRPRPAVGDGRSRPCYSAGRWAPRWGAFGPASRPQGGNRTSVASVQAQRALL